MINAVTILKKEPQVTVNRGPGITILNKVIEIIVYSEELAMPTGFRQFDFTATEGQAAFTLASNPVVMVGVYINGTAQNQVNGDFTVVGKVLTLSSGINAGDHIFGIYQEVAA